VFAGQGWNVVGGSEFAIESAGEPNFCTPNNNPGLSGDRQIMRAVDHRFALSKPALAWRSGQKIVLQRQLSDLGMQHRQIHRRSLTVAATLRAKQPGCPVEKLCLPLRDLIGINVELLNQLGRRLLPLDGG
jgi:hypothetical protein